MGGINCMLQLLIELIVSGRQENRSILHDPVKLEDDQKLNVLNEKTLCVAGVLLLFHIGLFEDPSLLRCITIRCTPLRCTPVRCMPPRIILIRYIHVSDSCLRERHAYEPSTSIRG